MLGKLVWIKTGDEIEFAPVYPDLLCYYVEALNSKNANSFSLQTTKFSFDYIRKLKECIKSVETVSNKIPFKITDWDGDVFDQNYLNQLHRQWVLTGIEYPTMPLLLRKMNNLDIDYRDINHLLHNVESSFKYSFVNYDKDPCQIDNIFGTKILGFDLSNVTIGFDNLGRSSWEKFCNFDENALDNDTNNFDKLSGLIHVNLDRPFSKTPPAEYLDWCKLHRIPVVGNTVSLGNIINLDSKLTDLRKIMVRNTNEQNDRFCIEICAQ
jgi:hypothetical protein